MKAQTLLAAGLLLAAQIPVGALDVRGPTNQVVSLNANVTLAVTATSTNPPITYQWWGKGVLLPDQTNRTCVLTNIQLDQAGEYYVVVNHGDNQPVQSSPATVTVEPTFIKLTEGPIVTESADTEKARWWDPDGDGWLDLFVNHMAGVGSSAPPSFFQNNRDGTFTKVTTNALAQARKRGVVSAVGDFDNDGDPDLFVENYEGPNQLHRNDGRGLFTRITQGSIVQSVTGGLGFWGDYDNDGWLDLFAGGDGVGGPYVNALHRNLQGTGFTNVAASAGVARRMACWAAAWGDYDNDGWLDLFASVFLYPGTTGTNILFHNRGDGTFESIDVGSPIREGRIHATVMWADYDNDGFLDLFLGCGGGGGPEHDYLYRNILSGIGNASHWLKIKLAGQASNRSGIGAKIRVKATIAGKETWQVREITGNGSSAGGPGLVAHFGLGDSVQATTVRVEWPSGNVQELTDVLAGQTGQVPMTIPEEVLITPTRPSASPGGSVTLTSQRGGATDWQWYHDGVALESRTNRTLTLTNLVAADAGRYSVVATTATGTFTNYVYLFVDTRFEKLTAGDVVNDQMMGVQGAWGDYDSDGHLDLAVTGGYWDTTGAVHACLYHNDEAGNLVKVTEGPLANSRDRNCYLAWADYDNDDDLDLMVGVHEGAAATLYVNQGDGQFAQQRTAADWIANGVEARGSTVGWADYDADGYVDLMLINWAASGGSPRPDALLHNLGDGRFEVITNSALALRGTSEETIAWVDYDGDGDLDFSSVESDSSKLRRLFRNLGHGSFEAANSSPFWGEARNYSGHAWADFDNDGDLDVAVCALNADASRDVFFLNDGVGNLVKADLAALGLGLDFGDTPAWGDYDNDGNLDLFCSGGTILNRLFHNRGDGTFEEIRVGTLPNEADESYSGSWGDCNGDGYLDLFVANGSAAGSRENDFFYRNNHREHFAQIAKTYHWLQINLRGTASNRSGIGARVRVTATIGGKLAHQLRQIGGQTCAPDSSSLIGVQFFGGVRGDPTH